MTAGDAAARLATHVRRSSLVALVLLAGAVAAAPRASASVHLATFSARAAAVAVSTTRVVVAEETRSGRVRLRAYGWSGGNPTTLPFRSGCGDVDTTGGAPLVSLALAGRLVAVTLTPVDLSSNFEHGATVIAPGRVLSCGPYDQGTSPTTLGDGARLVEVVPHQVDCTNGDAGCLVTDVRDPGAGTTLVGGIAGGLTPVAVANGVLYAAAAGPGGRRVLETVPLRTGGNAPFQVLLPFRFDVFGSVSGPTGVVATTGAAGGTGSIELFDPATGATIGTWRHIHFACRCVAVHGGRVAWLAGRHVYLRRASGGAPVILLSLPRGMTGTGIALGSRGLAWTAAGPSGGLVGTAQPADLARALR